MMSAHTSGEAARPISTALVRLGRDPRARDAVIAACLEFEARPEHRGTRVREEVTGPIVDALFSPTEVVRKSIDDGTIFEFFYRSQIARDFVMSSPSVPDHVWEPQTTRLLRHLASNSAHVVIAGAYFGDQAIPVARCLRDHGGVCHAFEADAAQRGMLARNAALNALDNLRISGQPLWSRDDAPLDLVGVDALGATVAMAAGGTDNVRGMRLDTYLDEQSIDDVQVIAADVEGGELEILRGAERRLSRPTGRAPHLVFEVHGHHVDWSRGLDHTDIVRYLAALGYTTFALRDIQGNWNMGDGPIELVPPEAAWLEGPPHGFNMVATKTVDVLGGATFRLCPGVSPKLLRHGSPTLHQPLGGWP